MGAADGCRAWFGTRKNPPSRAGFVLVLRAINSENRYPLFGLRLIANTNSPAIWTGGGIKAGPPGLTRTRYADFLTGDRGADWERARRFADLFWAKQRLGEGRLTAIGETARPNGSKLTFRTISLFEYGSTYRNI